MDNTQLTNTADYRQFKNCFDNEIRKVADGFVKIGYLLKVARDTDILYESGYKSITEFAQAEYNMTKDVVSRYIAINDKYSENGYSEYLQERYEGYGIAKLAEMLTLPDAVVEAMHPQLTRKEIQEIKAEVRAEEAVTEIEVMLEEKDKNTEEMSIMQKVLYQYFKENRLDFIGMAAVIKKESENSIEETLDIFAPSGIAVKTVRIAGEGKFMLSFKGKDNDIELVNVRGNSTTKYKWQEFFNELTGIFVEGTKEEWERIYKEPFAKTEPEIEETEEKVAPVQPEEVTVVVEGEVVTEQEALIPQENLEYHEEPGQIPGQMIVDDYPEIQPDGEWTSMYKVGDIVEGIKTKWVAKLKEKTNERGYWEILQKTEDGYKATQMHESNFKRSHQEFVDNQVDNHVDNSTETPQNVENTKYDTDSGEELENVDKIAEIVEEETTQSIENTKCGGKWTKDRIMRLFTQFVSLRDNVDCTKEEYSQLVSTASILVAIAERQEK